MRMNDSGAGETEHERKGRSVLHFSGDDSDNEVKGTYRRYRVGLSLCGGL